MTDMLLLASEGNMWGEAIGNTLVGIGVVFLTLLFLCGVISLFKYIGKLDKSAKKAPAKAPVKAAAPKAAAPKAEGTDPAVVAAICAAMAEKCGPQVKVVSIEKCK